MTLHQNPLANGGWWVRNPIIASLLPMNAHFSPELASPLLRHSLALFLVFGGAALGVLAWRRWRHNEYAMRLDCQLYYTRFICAVAIFLVVVALLLGIMLWG